MPLTPAFADALAFAANLHAGQKRKGTEIPYISHLLTVTAIVLESGGDEDQAIAAVLHDAAEDQGGEEVLEEIRRRFGDRVAAIVDACTDTYVSPKPPWRARKQEYLRTIPSKYPDAALVALADKLHNAAAILRDFRHLGPDPWSRFNAGRDDIVWYYQEVARAFAGHPFPDLLRELHHTVQQIEQETAKASA